MWPIVPSYTIPYIFDDFPDVYDVAFMSPYEGEFFNNLLGAPKDDMFVVKVQVGHYKSNDIKINVDGQKLKVHGKKETKSKYGVDKSEFNREFDLPKDVLTDTLTHYVTSDGVLVIEAKKKIDVRYPFQDHSNKDKFEVIFDVKCYLPEEVNVTLHEKTLIVEGSHVCETKCKGSVKEENKSFKRVIKLDRDVDENTLKITRKKDGYMKIEAKKDPKKALEGAKRLSITHE